jgi:hypothetical protein
VRVMPLLLCMCAVSTSMSAQTVLLRPGRYEAIAETEIAGRKRAPETVMQCFTADDLKDLSKLVAGADEEMMKDCVVSDRKATASRLTFNATCTNGETKWTMSVDLAYTPDSFTAVVTSKDALNGLTLRTEGKRIGEC